MPDLPDRYTPDIPAGLWTGWVHTAVSAQSRLGDWSYSFTVPTSVTRVITGARFGDIGPDQSPTVIQYGLYIERAGGVNVVYPFAGQPNSLRESTSTTETRLHISYFHGVMYFTAGTLPDGDPPLLANDGLTVLPGTVSLWQEPVSQYGAAWLLAGFSVVGEALTDFVWVELESGAGPATSISGVVGVPHITFGFTEFASGLAGDVAIPVYAFGYEAAITGAMYGIVSLPYAAQGSMQNIAVRGVIRLGLTVSGMEDENWVYGLIDIYPHAFGVLEPIIYTAGFVVDYSPTLEGRDRSPQQVELRDGILTTQGSALVQGVPMLVSAQGTDSTSTFYRTAVEVFSAAAATLRSQLAYSVKLDESVIATLTPAATDIVLLGDVIRAAAEAMTFYRTSVEQVDTAELATALLNSYGTNVSDTAVARDLNFLQGVFDLLDRISAGDEVALGYAPSVELIDALRGDDAVVLTSVVQLLSALSAGDAVQLLDALQLNDRLLASAEVGALRTRMAEATDAAQALTEARLASVFYLWEQATVGTDELARLLQSVLLLDRLEVSGQGVADRQLGFMIIDRAHAADELLTVAHFIQLLREGATAIATFRLGDEAFFACVMNTEGAKALSTYTNYPFNSFAQLGGRMLAAADSGLYELGGDTDDGAPINARLKSLMTDMGTSRMKRVRSAYMGYTASGRLVLKLLSVDAGQLVETWFEAHDLEADAPRAQRVQTALGLRSRYWQFELANIDGADFELDELELHPLYLNRRV